MEEEIYMKYKNFHTDNILKQYIHIYSLSTHASTLTPLPSYLRHSCLEHKLSHGRCSGITGGHVYCELSGSHCITLKRELYLQTILFISDHGRNAYSKYSYSIKWNHSMWKHPNCDNYKTTPELRTPLQLHVWCLQYRGSTVYSGVLWSILAWCCCGCVSWYSTGLTEEI